MTYAELQTAVIGYFKRSDIAARIPSWITLAEASLFRELDVSKISDTETGFTVGGLIALPADLQTITRLTVTVAGVEQTLDYITPNDDIADAGGYPDGYTIQGGSIRIYPDTGNGTAYTLYYVPKVSNLSNTVTTNWILDNASDLYLYATALHGAAEMKNSAEVASLTPIVARLVESTKSYAQRIQIPNSGGLQIKPRRGFK